MIIDRYSISLNKNKNAISFWVNTTQITYEQRAIVLDILTRSVIGEIPGRILASSIDWNDEGYGVFSLIAPPEGSAQILTVHPDNFSIAKSFDMPSNTIQVKWLSNTQVAFLTAKTDDAQSLINKGDIGILDLMTAQIEWITNSRNISNLNIVDGEIWCVRNQGETQQVYSISSDNEIWLGDKYEIVDHITDFGLIVVLKESPRILPLASAILKHPHRYGRIIPALLEKCVCPMGISVVDCQSGDILWSSPTGEVCNPVLRDKNTIAMSIRLGSNKYAVAEYDMRTGSENIIARDTEPVNLTIWSEEGWIATRNDEEVIVLHQNMTDTIFR